MRTCTAHGPRPRRARAGACRRRPRRARPGDRRVRRADPARRGDPRRRRRRERHGRRRRHRQARSSSKLKDAIDGVGAKAGDERRRPPAAGGARWPGRACHAAAPCPPIRATARSPSSTPGSAVSPCCTSCSCSCPQEDFVYLGDTARFPYGERTPGRARGASRCRSPRSCSRDGAKLLVVACNSATAAALPALQRADAPDDARRRRARRRAARGGAGRDGHAQRAHRAAGDAGDGRQRRLRRGGRRRRSARRPRRGRRARTSRRSSRAASRSTTRVVDDRPRLRRAAARGRRRHRDPRLHALPAGPPDAPADARPRRRRSSPPAPRSRGRSSTRSARAASATAARRGEGDYRFLCTGDTEAFRALGTRFLQMPLGEVEHVDLDGSDGGVRMSRDRDPLLRPRRPTGCGRRRSSPASCAPRRARR